MKRPALALFLAAFFLRAAAAVVTEVRPIFPDYYYTDARFMHSVGAELAQGRWEKLPGAMSQRVHGAWLAGVYKVFGPRPLAAKLLNAAAGAGAVALLYALALPIFGAGPAFLAAALTAVWPSHVFFTSQNFKDALVLLLCYAALRSGPLAALAMVPLGLLRSYVMLVAAVVILPWGALGVGLQQAASRALFHGPLKGVNEAPTLIPTAGEEMVRPLSPRGISEFRRIRQDADRDWARKKVDREISTQLFADARLDGWLDLALFLPKAAFHVLYMPLPGLYPMEGKLGRWLAGLENVVLLGLSILAVFGALRLRSGWRLLAFFIMMAGGSALLEFDLGSSTRHKILYLPLLFPFAFAGRRARPKRPKDSLRVAQVVECGGPGGTGAQVAHLCKLPGLETILVYNVREGSAEDYAAACGAARSHRVAEFTRELSPREDFRAFLRLYRLFRDEAPDVVHAHSSKAGALARPAAWLCGVPTIYYSPHGYGFLQADRSAWRRVLYKTAEIAVSWIGTVVAVSPGEAELASELTWGRPVETVCDPYLGKPIQATAHEGPLRVGACGRITAARRPEAFGALARAFPDIKFVWIGDGAPRPAGVEVTGWLSSAEVSRKLAGLDVFVHYSAWDALPNAVLEAMAAGLPVVASPAAKDALGEAGLYAQNESELAACLKRLLKDPALRAGFGEAGKKRVAAAFGRVEASRRMSALYLV